MLRLSLARITLAGSRSRILRSLCLIISEALHCVVEMHLFLHVCDVLVPDPALALAVHVAVPVEAVAIVVAPVALAEQSHDAIVALCVVQMQQVWRQGPRYYLLYHR